MHNEEMHKDEMRSARHSLAELSVRVARVEVSDTSTGTAVWYVLSCAYLP